LGATLFIDTYYDSNIFIASDGERGDFVTLIKPYITYESNPGNLSNQTHEFGVYYSPEFQLFASTDSENAINQSAQAVYRYTGDHSFFNISHRFRESEGANIDIGNRASLLRQVTLINGGLEFADDYQWLYGGKQNLRYYDRQNDRHDWQLYSFLMKEVARNLQLGVGARGGWVDTALSSNQTYQNILGRLIWTVTNKLRFDFEAGVDMRQFDGLFAIGDYSTFTYRAQFIWDIFDDTNLALSTYRRTISSSGINSANYDNTGVRAELTQRICDQVSAQMGAGYENADYYSTVTNNQVGLKFNYFFLRPALLWSPSENIFFEFYYRYSNNNADIAIRDFDRHQTGIQTTIEF